MAVIYRPGRFATTCRVFSVWLYKMPMNSLSSLVNSMFVVSDLDPPERVEEIRRNVGQLSPRQRGVVLKFFERLSAQGWQAPMLIDTAMEAVRNRRLAFYDSAELLTWCRQKEKSGPA